MNTREVADYLRIKERKVYDLIAKKAIPCTRVTGKWLFPKPLIDAWLAQGMQSVGLSVVSPPAVVVGSHDPLLDWSLRESNCDLATLPGGSLDGLRRFARGDAVLCGLHIPEADGFNSQSVASQCAGQGTVMVEWAWREQGLVLAKGNPLNIISISELVSKNARVAVRQPDAGSRLLFQNLIEAANINFEDLNILTEIFKNENDLGLAILDGKADAGLGISAVARGHRLDFLPLHQERFDLLIHRRDYFNPPFQALLAFTQTELFQAKAQEMSGYDITKIGKISDTLD
jgi:excisionase family DNA binding protein